MTELERALVALGRELDVPPEPDLRAGVRARIERRPRYRRALVPVLVALLAALGIAMAVPDARSAILRFFHIGGVTIERVDTLPPARNLPLTAGLGSPLSLREAEARSGVKLVLRGARPQRFYAQSGLIAAVLERNGKQVLLAEMQGDLTGFAKKVVDRDTRVEPASIGSFGLWLSGGRHVLFWQAGSGEFRRIEPRLAGNVLIWTEGDRTFRLEGGLDREQMLDLGRQITR
jgi:hypothetical protein